MATILYERDANPDPIRQRKVAIIGYGSQGHAHALNLKDSGVAVRVGLRSQSSSVAAARRAGLEVGTAADVAAWAAVIMILAPDTEQPRIYREAIAPHLGAGKMLMFAHGFNIRFGTITPPAGVDVTMVAPKSPGHRVREQFVERGGTPALLAIHQDATGHEGDVALSYAWGIGVARAREEMRRMLAEIRDGTFARAWIAENEAGRPNFTPQRAREQHLPIEQVGARLRAMMPFLGQVAARAANASTTDGQVAG